MLSTICKVSTILQIFLQFEISITIIYWFHAPLNPAFNNRIAKNNVASSCWWLYFRVNDVFLKGQSLFFQLYKN